MNEVGWGRMQHSLSDLLTSDDRTAHNPPGIKESELQESGCSPFPPRCQQVMNSSMFMSPQFRRS